MASLRAAGMEPVRRHLLTKDTKPGPTESTISLRNLGEIMSREQCEGFILAIVSLRGIRVMGSKASQVAEVNNCQECSV